MTTAARWIDYLPLTDLVRAEWNPKLHHPDIGTAVALVRELCTA